MVKLLLCLKVLGRGLHGGQHVGDILVGRVDKSRGGRGHGDVGGC